MALRQAIPVGMLVAMLLAWISLVYGPPWFWGSFVGWTEEQVIRRLGQPWYDERQEPSYIPGNDYTLGWYHGVGCQLGLKFKNGVVQRQWRGSK